MRALSMWVIYERPRDYPEHFVVRRWEVAQRGGPRPTSDAWLAPSLSAARCAVPAGRFNMGRAQQDDAVISEVWI